MYWRFYLGYLGKKKKKKRHPICEGISQFVDDKTIYTENPKKSTKEQLELINEFISKSAEYQTNMQKSIIFPYTCNGQSRNEINETAYTIASDKIKY